MSTPGPSSIPEYSLPDENRRVLLVERPSGVPGPEHFRIESTSRPEPDSGEFVVRNIYLSVDPAQRGWAQSAQNYSDPVPLGTPMRALAVAVVTASRDPEIAEGQFLYGWFGWQDYSVTNTDAILARIEPGSLPLSCYAGVLGINGVTAYLALTTLGEPRSGDVLLVSTAAGAVGSFAGQIGRILGCRTLGLTSTADKVDLAQSRYGYDAAYNYREDDLDAVLATGAPGGIDIYFDNTGGAILDTALRHMASFGRVVQCGTASVASWDPPPSGPRNEREVLTRRLTWRGFVIFDHLERWPEAVRTLTEWLTAGTLVYDEDIDEGIEAAPGALAGLYDGRNRGKKLIWLR